ncbi:hypothetical protein CSB20_03700 [bacterium DOLZORAL124_64_63]|nr:MAG: hypothetical protein CSB20_03700 [bacterium DOLZORAL124_64_63]
MPYPEAFSGAWSGSGLSLYFLYFYPLGLAGDARRQPVLTFGLALLMTGAFVWLRYFPDRLPLDPAQLIFYPGNSRLHTVATAIFLHSGWLHLLGNLVYFYVFGAALEARLGRSLFLAVFLILGVFGNLAHGLVAALGWLGQYGVGVLGASGAIAGLLGMALIRFRSSQVEIGWWLFAPLLGQNKVGRTPLPVPVAVGLWLGLQVVHSLVATEAGASVSYGAHLGGFGMGLVLAMLLGQWRLGTAEGHARRARRYFRRGAYHAAEGEWVAYLGLQPGDLEARLELARARLLTGQMFQAEQNLGQVFRYLMARGRVSRALEVFQEARRADLVSLFNPVELARVAYFQEKQSQFRESARTLELLFRRYPRHPEGQRALVRLVVLHMGKLDAGKDGEDLRRWLATARRYLPQGGWRDFLESELKAAGGLGADTTPDHPPAEPQPVSPEP